jgi:hypothetical protein
MRGRAPALAALLVLVLPATAALGAEDGPIEDNSFLVEEAYNQEARVVQHIVTWTRARRGGAWEAAFTQEWPVIGRRHQVSYTVPVQRTASVDGGELGIGDVTLHYRFMALGVNGGRVAFAPRVSWSLPTGDQGRGLGAGGQGIQFNLPLSLSLPGRWVAHSNAGVTWTRGPDPVALLPELPLTDERRVVNLGQSVIWLAARRVNLMLELAWERSEAPGHPGEDREESLLLSPGLRWARDFDNGLQIVPGIGVPIGLGVSRGERAVLLYLSVEHAF